MKISVALGLTINMGSGEYIKPMITINDIDLSKDVDKQIEEAIPAIEKANETVFNLIMDRLKGLNIKEGPISKPIKVEAKVEVLDD